MTFCPLTKEECRSDCAWAHEITEIDEDGVTDSVLCAMAYVGAWCMIDTQGNGDSVYFDE
jgi:hypothetical protein